MNYEITLAPSFERDLDNLIAFYVDKNINYCKKLFDKIEETIVDSD